MSGYPATPGNGGTNGDLPKAFFMAEGEASFSVSADPNAPSFLQLLETKASRSFTITDAPTGTIRNDSGRTLSGVTGTVSFHASKGSGATAELVLFSERSTDNGATWLVNPDSLRRVPVTFQGPSFRTLISDVVSWEPNALVRFRLYDAGGATISVAPVSDTVLGGQTITGPSVKWNLQEQ